MTSLIAITILVGSTLMVLSNLRLVAQDTLTVVRQATYRLLGAGRLWQNVAYGALWVLIFALASH